MRALFRTVPALIIVLATSSCGAILGVFRGASLEIRVADGTYDTEWQHQPITVNSSLQDEQGLAGLEITVPGEGTFTASDVPTKKFGVPESGGMTVEVRLRQEGQVVASGTASWQLESDVEWRLEVERVHYPQTALIVMNPEDVLANRIQCYWFRCSDVWAFPITAEAANYPHERLWLTLYRIHPGECADVC